ncbi:MAG: FHA domain-containing protein, partial [Wenzhouxiangella sp.]|nr:FHA domain-containing protein [Wenzhouxiangella sp.]
AKRLVIDDLDSRNGTWVDGHPLDRAALKPGSRVLVGGSQIVLEGDGGDGEWLTISTAQPAIGLILTERHADRERPARTWQTRTGGLSGLVGLAAPGPSSEELAGLRSSGPFQARFSEPELDHDLARRRERIGHVGSPAPDPQRRRVGQVLNDHAVLSLAGDLEADRRNELVDSTLDLLEISHLKEQRHDQLSPLQRRLVEIAVELLRRPGLLVIDSLGHDLAEEECRFLIERLRALAGDQLSILVLTEREPPGLRPQERLDAEPAHPVEPGSTLTSPAPRAASRSATATLFLRRLAALRLFPAAAAEALLLPLLLTPALWLILPSGSAGLAEIAAVGAAACSAALFAASESCRCYRAIVAPVRRHLLLSDSLASAALLALVVAAAQLLIVIAWTRILPGTVAAPALLGAGAAAVTSAACLGLLVALACAGRTITALSVIVALLLGQLVLADRLAVAADPGAVLSWLGNMSALAPAIELLEIVQREDTLYFPLELVAILLGQAVLWLVLARLWLKRTAIARPART